MSEIEKIRPRVFLAEIDGDTWWEKTINPATNAIVDYTDGRHSDAAGDFDALDLPAGVVAMIAYETPAGMRYAKITSAVPVGTLVKAKLTQVGGSAGNSTTACTFTYTAKDHLDNDLITVAEGPECPRIVTATHIAATLGSVYQTADGVWHLYQAFERINQTNCGS